MPRRLVGLLLAIFAISLVALLAGVFDAPREAHAQAMTLGNWSVVSATSTSATGALSSKAAATGVTHIATSATCCLVAVNAQTAPLYCDLRDGSLATSTVMWTGILTASTGTTFCVESPPLNLPGTAGNAMTLESDTSTVTGLAAPATGNFFSTVLTGYDRN